MVSYTPATLLLLATTAMAGCMKRAADGPQKVGNNWVVKGAGTFTQHVNYDFTNLNALPKGLVVSLDNIEGSDGAKAQKYTAANTYVKNGVLNMKVPGGQAGKSTIEGSQINTDFDLLYGSIRTYAKIGASPGTCSGFFSYNNQNLEEVDIEILTANMTRMHYTNQNPDWHINGGEREQTKEGAMPSNPTTTFHQYRTDWLPGKVRYYLDDKLQAEIDTYTPKVKTPWVWNNWSNGDKGWSAGPPPADNILQIQRIEMFYNATAKA